MKAVLTDVYRFIDVANSSMCQPIRSLTEGRGRDTSSHNLASFGGAGGQHACAIAQTLGGKRVLVHRYSSLLSAYGIGLADVVHEEQKPYAKPFPTSSLEVLDSDLRDLEEEAQKKLMDDGFLGLIDSTRFLNMRYDGSDTALMISINSDKDAHGPWVQHLQEQQ